VRAGDEISELYDPMIAKLIVHDVDREHARKRMLRALEEFVIEVPTTLLGFHRALLESTCFVEGGTCGAWWSRRSWLNAPRSSISCLTENSVVASGTDGRQATPRATTSSPSRSTAAGTSSAARCRATVGGAGETTSRAQQRTRVGGNGRRHEPDAGHGALGRVSDGDAVSTGDLICVVEAMKMENEIVSHADGVVAELAVAAGEPVSNGQVICVIASA
jgi:acetyl-CoA/propionyl-CoA carboxylase biotin carboxyl carrier protein